MKRNGMHLVLTESKNKQQLRRTPYTPQRRSNSSRECLQRHLDRLQ
jgi:hypothetical protein